MAADADVADADPAAGPDGHDAPDEETVVVSVSLPSALRDAVDRWADAAGYAGRSDAVRFALRNALDEHADEARLSGQVIAVVVLRFDHGAESELAGPKHRFAEEIRSMLHVHSGGEACIEVLVVQGEDDRVKGLLSALRGTRGVRSVKPLLIS